MKTLVVIFNLFAMLIFACSKEEKANLHQTADSALVAVLKTNKNGSWDEFYLIHSVDEQRKMLADAFLRLSIMAKAEVPASRPAREILERHFNRKEAELEVKNSKNTLSGSDKINLALNHIQSPELLYKEWRCVEEEFDENHVHLGMRKRVASDIDFKILVTDQTAIAVGKENSSLKVEFVKEAEVWKVKRVWNIYSDVRD